jgi:hypothetical protein
MHDYAIPPAISGRHCLRLWPAFVFRVPILGPLLGGRVGAVASNGLIRPFLPAKLSEEE